MPTGAAATKSIILKPGEVLIIRAADITNGVIQDTHGRYVLPVPYLSQWSPTAQHAPGDCGPACVAMAIHYLTNYEPTVDAVSAAAEVPKGARWSSFTQLAKAARSFGVQATHIRPLGMTRIRKEIQAGRPVLALVKYDLLSTKEDPNQDDFTGAHFVLIVGFSHQTVIFHDPDRLFGQEFGEFRETPWGVFLDAMANTSKTPGNTYDNHGMTFDA